MGGRLLLDTNIVIASFAGESDLVEWLDEADDRFISVITLGELYYGAANSSNKENNLTRLREFARRFLILNCDDAVSEHYGDIKHKLKIKGTPIPDNDIWIAATAMRFNLSTSYLETAVFR
jgi:tRNA(fMet)-specific endonuclease VapC